MKKLKLVAIDLNNKPVTLGITTICLIGMFEGGAQ